MCTQFHRIFRKRVVAGVTSLIRRRRSRVFFIQQWAGSNKCRLKKKYVVWKMTSWPVPILRNNHGKELIEGSRSKIRELQGLCRNSFCFSSYMDFRIPFGKNEYACPRTWHNELQTVLRHVLKNKTQISDRLLAKYERQNGLVEDVRRI